MALRVLIECPRWLLGDAGRLSGVDLVVTDELVLVDAPLALEDPDVAGLLKNLRPAPNGSDVDVAVGGKPRLGDGDPRGLPGVGDEDVPEGSRAGLETTILEDTVGQPSIGLDSGRS